MLEADALRELRELGVEMRRGRLPVYHDRMTPAQRARADEIYDSGTVDEYVGNQLAAVVAEGVVPLPGISRREPDNH